LSETVDPDAQVEPQEPHEDRPLQEIHPNIVENFQDLDRSFTMELVGPYSAYAFLTGYEQSAILFSGVYFDPVKTDTLTVFSELSEISLVPETLALLNIALTEKNRRVDIVLGSTRSEEQIALAKKLYGQISHPSFGIFQSGRPLPFGGLVLEPYVAVGSFHPLRDVLIPGKNDGFTYVIKNVEVAQSILQIKQKAKKVPRPGDTNG